MTPKAIADTAMVILMPPVLIGMVWLALKVPRLRSLSELLGKDDEEITIPKRYIAMAVVAVGAAVMCGALASIEIVGWLANNKYALRVVFAGIFCLFAFAIAPFLPGNAQRYAVASTLFFTGLWLVLPNWLTASMLGLVLCTIMVTVLQPKIPFLLLSAVICVFWGTRDVIQVFVTGDMQKALLTAIDSTLPIMVAVPGELSLTVMPESGLGLGDIVPSAVLLVAAARLGRRVGRRSIFIAGLAGYVVGDLAVIAVGKITGHFQPATAYFLPAITLGVVLAALLSGNGRELLRRNAEPPSSAPLLS